MFVRNKPGNVPGTTTRVFSPPITYKRLWKEFERKDECCFVWTIGKYALGEFTLDEYLNGVLDHLRKDGPRHTYDDRPGRLLQLLHCDYVSGVVKRLMFEPDFHPLSHNGSSTSPAWQTSLIWKTETEQLKKLCKAVFQSEDRADLLNCIQEVDGGASILEYSSPYIMDLLAIIAYSCRKVDVLEYLLTVPPPPTTTFDRMEAAQVEDRVDEVRHFQHSPYDPTNAEMEMRLWAAIMSSGWLHAPVSEYQAFLVSSLLGFLNRKVEPRSRDSAYAGAFIHALRDFGIVPWPETVSGYLSGLAGQHLGPNEVAVPCTAAQADLLFSVFPAASIPRGPHRAPTPTSSAPPSPADPPSPAGTPPTPRWGSPSDTDSEPSRPPSPPYRPQRPPAPPGGNPLWERGESMTLLLALSTWPVDDPLRLTLARAFLDAGADPNDRAPDLGGVAHGLGEDDPGRYPMHSPLRRAAGRGDAEMVRLLLERGARDGRPGRGPVSRNAAATARRHRFPECSRLIEQWDYERGRPSWEEDGGPSSTMGPGASQGG